MSETEAVSREAFSGGKALLRLRSLYKAHEPLRSYSRLLSERCAGEHLRILDIGCGTNTSTLSHLSGFAVGIDIVPEFAPAPGVRVVRGSGERIPFCSGYFDLVCCRAVLEHVEAPEHLFAEVARVLRPGGSFVVLTPNKWDYVSLMASAVPNRWHPILIRRLTGRPEEDTFPTFYRANTRRRLRALADRTGLTVESIELRRQHPHYLQFNSLLYGIGVVVEQCLQRPVSLLRPWILGVFRSPPSQPAP